jgi:hypothetical protein
MFLEPGGHFLHSGFGSTSLAIYKTTSGASIWRPTDCPHPYPDAHGINIVAFEATAHAFRTPHHYHIFAFDFNPHGANPYVHRRSRGVGYYSIPGTTGC